MFIAKRSHCLDKFHAFVSCGVQGYCTPVISREQLPADEKPANTTVKNRKFIEVKPLKKTLSRVHAERAFNKHLFGPLAETKEEKNQRLEKNESESLAFKCKPRKWYSYNKIDYEGFAAVYSGNEHSKATTKLPIRGVKSALVKNQRENKESSKAGLQSTGDKIFSCAVNDPPFQLSNNDHKMNLGSASNVFPEAEEDPKKGLKTFNNTKYFDVPCLVNIHSCLTFPLLHDTRSHINESIFENYFNSESASVVDTCDEERKHNPIKKVPSVSHILSSTMSDASKAALARWEKQMTEQLGEEGFQIYKKELFSQGTLLHRCIHTQLETHLPPAAEEEEQLKGLWTSVKNVVLEVEQTNKVYALESSVMHPHLHYLGIIDCVAVYRDTPVVIEWKTSSRVKRTLRSTYDNPLQLAAYLGAMQFDPAFQHLREVQSGLIVLSYSSGEIGDTHIMTPAQLNFYWRQWLRRLAKFWTLQRLEQSSK